MAKRVVRLHPLITLVPRRTWRSPNGKVPVTIQHFQQSDLDSACGPHCLVDALRLLRLMTERELSAMTSNRGAARHRRFWQLLRRYYFIGTSNASIKRILEPFAGLVDVFEPRRRQRYLDFAMAQLTLDRLVLLGVYNRTASTDHWVLAVGVQGIERVRSFEPEHLLLLDPGLPALPLSAWNSLLAVTSSTSLPGTHRVVEHSGDTYQVKLTAALAIGRVRR